MDQYSDEVGSMREERFWFVGGYLWLLPVTLFALVLVPLLGVQLVGVSSGIFVFHSKKESLMRWWFERFGFAGITLGACIFFRRMSDATQPRMVRHELQHVAQGMRWGPLFPLAYLGASLISRMRGSGIYTGNAFEAEARQAEAPKT